MVGRSSPTYLRTHLSSVSRRPRESPPVPSVVHENGLSRRVFRRTRQATSGRCWSQQQVEAAGIETADLENTSRAGQVSSRRTYFVTHRCLHRTMRSMHIYSVTESYWRLQMSCERITTPNHNQESWINSALA